MKAVSFYFVYFKKALVIQTRGTKTWNKNKNQKRIYVQTFLHKVKTELLCECVRHSCFCLPIFASRSQRRQMCMKVFGNWCWNVAPFVKPHFHYSYQINILTSTFIFWFSLAAFIFITLIKLKQHSTFYMEIHLLVLFQSSYVEHCQLKPLSPDLMVLQMNFLRDLNEMLSQDGLDGHYFSSQVFWFNFFSIHFIKFSVIL